jgi:hypothetical protein
MLLMTAISMVLKTKIRIILSKSPKIQNPKTKKSNPIQSHQVSNFYEKVKKEPLPENIAPHLWGFFIFET